MDIQHLRNFVAIADEGSLTAAAKKLFVAQPALSNQLKSLEKEFNALLMKRGARKIELTDAGKILYAKSKNICELESSAKKEITDCADGLTGTLHLGLPPSSAISFFNHQLLRFAEQNPNIRCDLYELGSFELLNLLKSGVIEVGIIRTPFQNTSEFKTVFQQEYPMIAAYQKGSHWFQTEEKNIPVSFLSGLPLCIIRRYEEIISKECVRAGISPNFMCVNTQITTNLLWAKNGMGISIVPLSALDEFHEDSISYKIIDNPHLYTGSAIITLKNRYLSSVAKNFLSLYTEEKGEESVL